jgi:hypothetical protein
MVDKWVRKGNLLCIYPPRDVYTLVK